jgi:hypothetical protein
MGSLFRVMLIPISLDRCNAPSLPVAGGIKFYTLIGYWIPTFGVTFSYRAVAQPSDI